MATLKEDGEEENERTGKKQNKESKLKFQEEGDFGSKISLDGGNREFCKVSAAVL